MANKTIQKIKSVKCSLQSSAAEFSKKSPDLTSLVGWAPHSPPVEDRVKVKASVTAEAIWWDWQLADGTVVSSVTSLSSLSHFNTEE